MLTLLGLSSLTIPGIPITKLLVFILVPSFYITLMVRDSLNLNFNEMIAIDCTLGLGINTLLLIYLSFFLNQFTEEVISISLFLVTLITFLAFLPKLLSVNHTKSNPFKYFWHSLPVIISFLIGFGFIVRVIPDYFWKGFDPWLSTPIALKIIQEGINPFQVPVIYGENLALSAFYYFLAGASSYSGLELNHLNRYGGAMLTGIICVLIYVLIKKNDGTKAGLIASFFLCLNPFFVERFSMALRENFAFIFLLIGLLLTTIRASRKTDTQKFNFIYVFILSIFLSMTLSSHSLTPVFSFGFVILLLIHNLNSKNFITVKEISLSIILSIALTFTHVTSAFTYFMERAFTHWLVPNYAYFIVIIVIAGIISFYVYLKKNGFKIGSSFRLKIRYFYLILGLLLLGSLIAIIFPKRFDFLGVWQPPIELDDFSISVIPLICIGFSASLSKKSVSKYVLYFSFLLLTLMNLTNLNVAFPQYRLLIYTSILLPYGVVKGIKYFVNTNFNHNTFLKKQVTISIFFFFLILLVPFVVLDVNNQKQASSYFNVQDVESTISFANLLTSGDIIIPQKWTNYLLRHVGIDLTQIFYVTTNFTVDKTIYTIKDYSEFIEFIRKDYPESNRAFVFIITRYLSDPNYYTPSIDMLEENAAKKQIGTITLYIVTV